MLQTLSALAGLAVSLYLLIQHTRLTSGIQDSASFCSFGRFADCDIVNASPYSELGGIPIAAFGACFYFLVLLLSVFGRPSAAGFRRAQRVIVWLATVALTIDAGLFVLQLVELRTLCLMCCLTYLASLGILAGGLWLAGKGPGSRWKRALAGGGEALSPKAIATTILTLVTFGIVIMLIPGFIRSSSQTSKMGDPALTAAYQRFKDLPERSLEVNPGDGTLGNPSARVQIVEFSDFECPFCQRTAFILHAALRSLESRVHFVYKYFPLDNACNPAVPYPMHLEACALARLAYCAERKGKFWEFHDLVFLKLSESDLKRGIPSVTPSLAPVLSSEEVTQCLNDDRSLTAVSDDIKLGNSLGIKGTPSLFINGKQIKDIPISIETLDKMVSIEESLHPPQ